MLDDKEDADYEEEEEDDEDEEEVEDYVDGIDTAAESVDMGSFFEPRRKFLSNV